MFIDLNAEVNVINLARAHGTTNATALLPMMFWDIRQGDKVEITFDNGTFLVNGHALDLYGSTKILRCMNGSICTLHVIFLHKKN